MSEAALQSLFEGGRLWRGQGNALPRSALPTGFAALDEVLPGGGWPMSALSEILLPADGVGELQLLWPLLARLSTQGGRIVLVAPPYIPFAPAWAAAGIALPQLQIVQTDDDRNAMWVAEQCLRSAACAAVVCWPRQADSRTLRRLQLAAETGQCQGFAMRPANVAVQPSMAALRILVEVDPPQWRVLKCRGGNPPARAIVPSPPSEGRGSARQRRGDVVAGQHEAFSLLGKPSPSLALRSRSLRSALRTEGEKLARAHVEPSPPSGFIAWGRGQGEGEEPCAPVMPRLRVAPAPSPSATRSALRAASPPSEADGGEGEDLARAS